MFNDASEALAYILTLLTVANLNRFIGAATEERLATHYRMVGHSTQPGVSPLSDEWAKLAAKYDMLAAMTTAGYAELRRRDSEEQIIAEAIFRGFGGVNPANADGSDHERPMPDEWTHETARGIEDYRPTDA